MIETTSIASGSNGNCYYIGNEHEAILIDAGISCKQIVSRMFSLNLDISKVKGIFVTHEHSDHIRGIEVFSRKFNIPVYMTEKTYRSSSLSISSDLLKHFTVGEDVNVGGFHIHSFHKQHDAIDPCSFEIFFEGKKIVVLTDFGVPCKNAIKVVKQCDVLFLESNYDDKMLLEGPYPYFLKKRIAGDYGHLSNYHAGLLVLQHAKADISHIFLSHLSDNNNSPDVALGTFNDILKERKDFSPKIILTDRDDKIDLFRID